jgi:GntR family transcriptional regulator, transcriptional repressor for pyruvate dehydrogenase complex
MTLRKHDEIADSLTRDILVGQYRTGERLPSERDLALRFDANRGAVREAMKKLEQLGIATVQPGGARVAPLHEASLDIIGHMLAMQDIPDEDLVDQILQVVQSLIALAAENAVRRGSDAEIADIRARVRHLVDCQHNRRQRAEARFALLSAILEASGNLICRLIARSLLVQFAPRMVPLEGYVALDTGLLREQARHLDQALADRNVEGVRAAMRSLAELNRRSASQAFAAIRAGHIPQEIAAS